ncbi:phosphate signaling complex protein PhoU [Peptostreptococcus equinus]|uniref:Phosphate-specific transport system accessory protein PhoU n=1 Tax=Peptostreptococcus equinus TaxID=3003601 RepID=A0ABY7JTH3_9FIRM|nr:phosphate signaling complex protein PhoU [Peptostreptococcus sp. CBA3647]WAW15212.1 phosphate signaling complex protein PhoU [Peptostreptococcus sp. CBA3647]
MEQFVKKGRTILNAELVGMNHEVIKISQRVSLAILKVKSALINQDIDVALEVVNEDEEINNLCIELEKHAYRVIALQQPISADLRQIIAIIRLIPDLERIGDHAKSIAKVIPETNGLDVEESLEQMAEGLGLLKERLDRATEAFVDRDDSSAREIAAGDKDIDAVSRQILREVIREMKQDVDHIKKVSKLLLLAKSVERMGDYIVNICESTVFLSTGDIVELL